MDGKGIPVTSESMTDEAVLFAALRRSWRSADPVPEGLADAMVAAVATADLGREYALLTRVESDAVGEVRGDADMLTMQFSDGQTNVLVHVTHAERGARRLDGWVDGDVATVRLIQEGVETHAVPDGGRFSFEGVASGVSRLRVVLVAAPSPGAATELLTPRFEL